MIIYTSGGGETLFYIFNGIQMILNEGVAEEIINIGALIAVVWTALQAALQRSITPQLSWVCKYALITSCLIAPKTEVMIKDTVYNSVKKVDKLSVGLVLPATLFNNLSYGITKVFEQAFSVVGDLSYTKYGTTFAASMISNARNYKIQDPIFLENIQTFIDRCVLPDALIGKKYDVRELRETNNIWSLVSSKASNLDQFIYRDKDLKARKKVTCKEGSVLLNSYWNDDIANLAKKLQGSLATKSISSDLKETPHDKNHYLDKVLKANINTAFKFFASSANSQNSAFNQLQQLMMINALNDLPSHYGVLRAKQHQQVMWETTGKLSAEYLPVLQVVFASIIYGSFILIIGLLVLPGGFRVFASYIEFLFWIELWAPLFSILNMIANIGSKSTGSVLSNGITMNNIATVVSTQANIAAVAHSLSGLLPFIAYFIVKGGVSQFVHLAGQITSASQSAASMASQEIVTGNRSFDNVSVGNSQMYNNTGFKTDLNSVTKMGHQEYQLNDGTLVRETPKGQTIFHAGPGLTTSVGSKSMSLGSVDTSQIHQSLGVEKSLMDSQQIEYSTTEQSLYRRASDFVARLASGESSGQHYNYGQNSAEGKSLSDIVQNTKDLHERYGYSWQQASEKSLNAGLGVNFHGGYSSKTGKSSAAVEDIKPEGILSKVGNVVGFTGNFDIGASRKATATDSSEQAFAEQKSISFNKANTNSLESVIRGAKEIQYSDNQSTEKSLADSMSDSYERMQQLRDSISLHQQNIDRYQKSIDHTSSSSFSVSDEMYQKELEYIANKKDKYGFNYGLHGAQKIMEQGGEEFNKLHEDFVSTSISSIQKMPNNINFDSEYDHKLTKVNDIAKTVINEGSVIGSLKDNENNLFDKNDYVNTEAQIKANEELSKPDPSIDRDRAVSRDKGNNYQQQINQLEQDRGFFGIKFGIDKNEKEKVDD